MRTKARLLAAGALAAAAAFGAAGFEAATLADYSGAELFERFCASCHGESGRGDGPVAQSLNVAVPDLTGISRRYGQFPAAQIRDVVDGRGLAIGAHGTRAMPVWGYQFFVEEGGDIVAQAEVRAAIARLVEHVRSLQTGSSTDPDAAFR
jgi:mono/diheme cytochrome c family protein